MTVELFLTLLTTFATLDSIVVEVIKKLTGDKYILSYNLLAIICGAVIGVAGCCVYYTLAHVPITVNNTIYAVLLGLAVSLTSQVGYDKVKQLIDQLR